MRDGFHAALRHKLDVEVVGPRRDQVCNGSARSFEDYQHRCGYLQAINDVLAICEEVESLLYSDNPLRGDK